MTHIRCSRYLWLLTTIMIGYPVFYLVFAAMIFELKSRGILSIVLSPMFYLSSLFWVVSGIGVRRLRHWSWYTFLAAQFFSTYLNALNLVSYSDSNTKAMAFAITILIQVYVHLAVSQDIRVPYLYPKIKWWESGLAAMTHVPVEVFHVSSPTGTSIGQMLDINQKGCFVRSPSEFEPFEKIKVRIGAYGQTVDVPGVVIWNAPSTVTHPKGIGVKFSDLDRTKRRKVRVISRRFQKERDLRHEPPRPVSA